MKYLFYFILFTTVSYSQTEIKKIKSTREKIEFVNDSIQNYKLFSMDGDYGHSGFTGPKYTTERFHQHWYNETFVHYINNIRFFDEKGKLVEEHWFDKSNDTVGSYKYFYTEFDSLRRTITSNRFKDIHTEDISYNNKKQSILQYWSNDTQFFNLEQFSYDDNSNLKEKKIIDADGLYRTFFYNYNKNNLLTQIVVNKPTVWVNRDGKSFYERKDSIGTTYIQSKFFYNEKKQLIKKMGYSEPSFNKGTDLSITIIYKYDKAENLTETYSFFPYNDNVYKKISKYDENSRLIFEMEFDDEKEYFYNSRNELKKLIVRTKKFEAVVTFEYKYDESDNWIEQTKFYNGKKLFVWKREISYY